MKKKVMVFALIAVCFFGFISDGFSQNVNTLEADQLKKLESISQKDNVSNADPAAVSETVKAFKEKAEGRNARAARTFYCGANDFKAVAGTTWEFTYQISSVYTDTIVIESSVETDSDGDCYLPCYDAHDSGSSGRVYYTDNNEIGLGFWAYVLNSTGNFIQNYEFSVSGNSASGVYYLYDTIADEYFNSYNLTGNKVNGGISYDSSLLIADFGYYGLYKYNGSYWSGIVGWNAESMTEWDGKLVADFGGSGLWTYDGASWESIDPDYWNAENIVGWDDSLVADFGYHGLWVYDGYSWDELDEGDAENIIIWGNKLAADFGSDGLYVYNGVSWTRIMSSFDAQSMVAWGNNLVADFGSKGLYSYNGSSWTGLTGWNPDSVIVWNDKLVADFGTNGFYQYNGYSWNGLAGWNPENMIVWGDKLILDFGSSGLWSYNGSYWSGLTGWNPENMIAWEDNLVADFGYYGIYLYNGSSWTGLTGWNPDDMEVLTY